MEQAIAKFKLPIQYDSWIVSESSRQESSQSMLYMHGVVASTIESSHGYFFCLASPECRLKKTKILLNSMKTSNGTTHLQRMHKLSSKKKSKMECNRMEGLADLDVFSNARFSHERIDIIIETLKFVENLWPFHGVESKSFQISRMFDKKKKLTVAILKHTLCEIYFAYKNTTIKLFRGKMVQIMVDMWTEKETNRPNPRKFLGVRVGTTDSTFKFHSRLIAVREFVITSEQSDSLNWTDLLKLHLTDILGEFGIEWSNVYGATSDAGSDVKKMLEDSILFWTWCISHVLHRMALQVSSMPAIRDMVANFSDISGFLKIRSNGLRFAEVKNARKGLKNFQKNRWVGLEDTIYRIILNFDALVNVYLVAEEPFPFYGQKPNLMQYRMLFHSLSRVSRAAQNPSPDSCECLRQVFLLRGKLLNDAGLYEDDGSCAIESDGIYEEVKEVRRELLGGLDSRIFTRYDDCENLNMVHELSMFLNPLYKNLAMMESTLLLYWKNKGDRRERFELLKSRIFETAKNMHQLIAEPVEENVIVNLLSRMDMNVTQSGGTQGAKNNTRVRVCSKTDLSYI